MQKRINATALFLFGILGAAAAFSGPAATPAGQNAISAQQILQREVARELAPVKSMADLYAALPHKSPQTDAVNRLSAKGRASFLASLTFNGNGLTGFNYRAIEDELSVSEAYQVLSLFGAQHIIHQLPGLAVKTKADALLRQTAPPAGLAVLDYQHHWCSTPHTCTRRDDNICMSAC